MHSTANCLQSCANIVPQSLIQYHQYNSQRNLQVMIEKYHRELHEMNKTTSPGNVQSKEVALALPLSVETWRHPSFLGSLLGAIQYRKNNNPPALPNTTLKRSAGVRVFIPQWIFRKVYEASLLQDQWKYSYVFQSYNLVDRYCKLFDYVLDGDIKGLQILFDAGLATPFDRDVDGWTPLHVSTHW